MQIQKMVVISIFFGKFISCSRFQISSQFHFFGEFNNFLRKTNDTKGKNDRQWKEKRNKDKRNMRKNDKTGRPIEHGKRAGGTRGIGCQILFGALSTGKSYSQLVASNHRLNARA